MPRRYRRSRRGYRRTRRSRRRTRRYGQRRMRETATSTQWGKPVTLSYRSRRRGTRSGYRSTLFNTTKFKAHYRSVLNGAGNFNTTNDIATASVHLQRALFALQARGGGNGFYQALGGALPIDAGVSVPTFNGNIILRGGIARCSVQNNDGTNSIRAEVISIWSNAHPQDKFATDFTVPAEWDPTCEADFHRFGKILNRKLVYLKPRENLLVTHRFAPQKIDQPEFIGSDDILSDQPSGSTLFWMIKIVPCNTVATNVIWSNTWNVSFSGDAT